MWNERRPRARRRQAGVTLIELIVALVIVGAALAGMVAVFASTARASADPVITQQMQAIADNMMEEILLKPYARGPQPNAALGGVRLNFDDVEDYDGYGKNLHGIRDVEGNTVAGLDRYDVLVTVVHPAGPGLPNLPAADTLQIDVTVTDTRAPDQNDPAAKVTLTGWRTNPS